MYKHVAPFREIKVTTMLWRADRIW